MHITRTDASVLEPGDRVRFDDGTFTVKSVELMSAGRVRVNWTDGSYGYFYDWDSFPVYS